MSARLCTHPSHTYEINSTQGLVAQDTTESIAPPPAAISAYVGSAAAGASPWFAAWTADPQTGRDVHCATYTGLLTSASDRRLDKETR